MSSRSRLMPSRPSRSPHRTTNVCCRQRLGLVVLWATDNTDNGCNHVLHRPILIRSEVHSFVHYFIQSRSHPAIRSCKVSLFIYALVHFFVSLFVRSFIRSFVHLFIHSCFH